MIIPPSFAGETSFLTLTIQRWVTLCWSIQPATLALVESTTGAPPGPQAMRDGEEEQRGARLSLPAFRFCSKNFSGISRWICAWICPTQRIPEKENSFADRCRSFPGRKRWQWGQVCGITDSQTKPRHHSHRRWRRVMLREKSPRHFLPECDQEGHRQGFFRYSPNHRA